MLKTENSPTKFSSSHMAAATPIAASDRFVSEWEKMSSSKEKDEELDSFLAGRETGLKESNRIVTKQFYNNVKHAQDVSEKLYNLLLDKGLKPLQVHIKSELITVFRSLFIVDINTFISDDFRQAFSIARALSKEEENDNFYINFSFMANTSSVNYECMSVDGYFLKYERKETKKRRTKTQSRTS